MKNLLNISLFLSVCVLLSCYGCKSWTAPEAAGPAEGAFWDEEFRPMTTVPIESTAAAEEAATDEIGRLVAVSESGSYVVSMIYPSVDYGIIQLDKTMPREVGLNQQFDYSIKVKNLTDITLTDIVVIEDLPSDFEFTSSTPIAKRDTNKLMWEMGSLGPKASKQITISGKGTGINHFEHRTIVTQALQVSSDVKVVQPRLELVMTAPSEALLCEPIPVEFVVTNTGTGSAQNVKIVGPLPAGLQTAEGKSEILFDVGTLAAGQSQQLSTQLRATSTGVFINKAVASAALGPAVESAATVTTVRQPKLTVLKTGPDRMP